MGYFLLNLFSINRYSALTFASSTRMSKILCGAAVLTSVLTGSEVGTGLVPKGRARYSMALVKGKFGRSASLGHSVSRRV